MTVLVTGASGFLGTAIVERLLAYKESRLRCFIRPPSDTVRLENLRLQYPTSTLEYVIGNLISPKDVYRALEGVTTVYHVAAQMRGAPASVFLNTVIASKRLLEAMLETRPRRVILVSSLSVYGSSRLHRKMIIDETAELEQCPEKRDAYSHAKLRQESLFREYQAKSGFELVILRPGVIYGRGGSDFSPRVGLVVGGWLLQVGRHNLLPFTYVDNCAEAIVVAGTSPDVPYSAYNVVDDDLPTGAEYLIGYRHFVGRIHSIPFPFCIITLLSKLVEGYSIYSHGQIAPILTPYKSAVLWKGSRYDNARIKSIGWQQRISTKAALLETFAYLKWRKNGCEATKAYADRCGATVASQAGRGERLTESKSSPALMQS